MLEGYVPGGGSIELALARDMEQLQKDMKGMGAFGVNVLWQH